MMMLDEILLRLESKHPEVFSVFDLHYFGGWGLAEIGEEILGIVDVLSVKLALRDFGISAIPLAWMWNSSSRMSPKVT